MEDNDVIRLLVLLLEARMTAIGLSNYEVRQGYQPFKVGIDTSQLLVFIHKVSAQRYGYPSRNSVFNTETNMFTYTERGWRIAKIRIGALTSVTSGRSASDLGEILAGIMQEHATRTRLLNSNIGITRIRNIRVSYFEDGSFNHRQYASFDFELSYVATSTTTVAAVASSDLNVRQADN